MCNTGRGLGFSFHFTYESSSEEVDFLQNLVVGMPTRIYDLIVREGGTIVKKKEIHYTCFFNF
jgi:hypothetical protein